MHVGFDQDVDTSYAIEGDFVVLVITPVAHLSHVFAICLVLLVA